MSFEDAIFNEKNEVKTKTVKFGKVGDAFKGTLLSVKIQEVLDAKLGRKVPKKIYQFKSHGGAFHDMDKITFVPLEPAVELVAGEYCVTWSRGEQFDQDMARAKPGFIVAMRYTGDTVPKPGKRPAKIVKVYIGGKDPEYMGENPEDVARDAGFQDPPLPPM